MTPRRNKFGAKKTEIDGIKFDSLGESKRYVVLKARFDQGFITNLMCHRPYDLTVNGQKVARYVADFVYEKDGEQVVEDFKCKSTITPVYRLKKKLMKACHAVEIKEVFKPDE